MKDVSISFERQNPAYRESIRRFWGEALNEFRPFFFCVFSEADKQKIFSDSWDKKRDALANVPYPQKIPSKISISVSNVNSAHIQAHAHVQEAFATKPGMLTIGRVRGLIVVIVRFIQVV